LINIEMAGYAVLPGVLALVAAVLIVPHIRWSIGLSSPIISRDLFKAPVLMISCLFLLILIFFEPGFSSVTFLAGILSTVLFLIFSIALFKSPGTHSSDREDRFKGWSLCLAATGLSLAAAGMYLAIFAWEDVSVLNAYAFGAACALVPIALGAVQVKEGGADLRPTVPAADFYVSSLCVLAAAMAMGTAMPEFQRAWIGMPVLFAMAGLAAFLAAAVVTRAAAHKRPWFYRGILWLSALSAVIVQYVIPGELTRKISSDAIAGLGMLDRMGPFWASITGVLTGSLLIILTRYEPSHSERGHKNLTFGFSLYFMAAGIWISYLFADLYGIAFAGMGLLGVVCLPAGQQLIPSVKKDSGSGNGLQLGVSIFSTIAVVAACLMRVREAADLDSGLTVMLILAGFLLGVGMAYVVRSFVKRLSGGTPEGDGVHFPFMSPDHFSCLALIFIPILIGLGAGPEVLGGFLAGMVLPGIYAVFRLDREGQSEEAGRFNGLMRLAALAVLLAAPLMLL
jgi:hypothetical protein